MTNAWIVPIKSKVKPLSSSVKFPSFIFLLSSGNLTIVREPDLYFSSHIFDEVIST